MNSRKKLDNSIRQLICQKFDAGKPIKVISEELDVKYRTVASILKVYKKEGFYNVDPLYLSSNSAVFKGNQFWFRATPKINIQICTDVVIDSSDIFIIIPVSMTILNDISAFIDSARFLQSSANIFAHSCTCVKIEFPLQFPVLRQ